MSPLLTGEQIGLRVADHLQKPLTFKFHWLNAQGQQEGFLRKKGRFDGETLTLGDTEIPAVVILHAENRDNRMVLTAVTADGTPAHLLFQPSSKRQAEELKQALDISRSKVWAAHHQQEMAEKGQGGDYRDECCPHCGATIVLSHMPETPQLFCRFCNRLTTLNPADRVKGEERLRLCDECGMFSQPRKYTIGYIVFLLVFVWYSYRSTWRCPACMRGEAWKMFFGNLPTLLGLPVAIIQLARSYGGGIGTGPFQGLDTGNIKARKGDLTGALASYRKILDRVPHCAGVKYNLGLALRQQNNKQQAADAFRIALDDCVNYAPAYAHLRELYEELGHTAELSELRDQWDDRESGDDSDSQSSPVPANHSDE